jgi:nucleoside 2-deoxyribosyltransferase
MKAYLAGPMRGIRDFNFPKFHRVSAFLREIGFEVFSPAERDEAQHGADVAKSDTGDLGEAVQKGFSLREALCADMEYICLHADAVVMLDGWKNSKGATAERATAIALGLMVFYWDDAQGDVFLQDHSEEVAA